MPDKPKRPSLGNPLGLAGLKEASATAFKYLRENVGEDEVEVAAGGATLDEDDVCDVFVLYRRRY